MPHYPQYYVASSRRFRGVQSLYVCVSVEKWIVFPNFTALMLIASIKCDKTLI